MHFIVRIINYSSLFIRDIVSNMYEMATVSNASCKNILNIKETLTKFTKWFVQRIMNNASWPNFFWIIGHGVLWKSAVKFGSSDPGKFILAYNQFECIWYKSKGIRSTIYRIVSNYHFSCWFLLCDSTPGLSKNWPKYNLHQCKLYKEKIGM